MLLKGYGTAIETRMWALRLYLSYLLIMCFHQDEQTGKTPADFWKFAHSFQFTPKNDNNMPDLRNAT